jgi:transaldolase
MNEGAPTQRLLFGSTSTKDASAPELLYVEALAAPCTVDTVPEPTLKAVIDHGAPGGPLSVERGAAAQELQRFREAGIDLDALAERLQREGAESFSKSWDDLMLKIKQPANRPVERGPMPELHP